MLYIALQCPEGTQGNFVYMNQNFFLLPQSHTREAPDPDGGVWRGSMEKMAPEYFWRRRDDKVEV